MPSPADVWSQKKPWPVKNTAASTAPARGLYRVTGFDATTGAITVGQPDADDKDPTMLMVGADLDIAVNGFGAAYFDAWERALYDSGDGTPALGEDWGAGSGSWKLRKGKRGFRVWGGVDGGSVVVARGYRAAFDVFCDTGVTPNEVKGDYPSA